MVSKDRVSLVVHVGSISTEATLVEWWKPLDTDVESRGLRFEDDDGGPWLDKFELPPELVAAGALIADVIATDELPGLSSPALAAGFRVRIGPAPRGPAEPNALGVWADDRAHIGYLPSEVAAAIVAESQRRRTTYSGIVLRDYRDAGTKERTGIKVLLGPGEVRATEPS